MGGELIGTAEDDDSMVVMLDTGVADAGAGALKLIIITLEVATSAVLVIKLVVPTRNTHFLPNLTLDWLTTAIRSTKEHVAPSTRKHARKHHFLLNTQCSGEFTPQQLSLAEEDCA